MAKLNEYQRPTLFNMLVESGELLIKSVSDPYESTSKNEYELLLGTDDTLWNDVIPKSGSAIFVQKMPLICFVQVFLSYNEPTLLQYEQFNRDKLKQILVTGNLHYYSFHSNADMQMQVPLKMTLLIKPVDYCQKMAKGQLKGK